MLKFNFHNRLQRLLDDPRIKSLRGIFLFAVITLSIHIAFRFWANTLHYAPITAFYMNLTLFMEKLVFVQCHWFIVHILHIPVVTHELILWFNATWGIIISEGCTGLKQIIQVLLLFILYPGPWKHKAWFIPSAILVIHFTNVIRIVLLGIAMHLNMPGIHFIHNYILRMFFYVVIFGMWLLWAEKIVPKGRKKTDQKPV